MAEEFSAPPPKEDLGTIDNFSDLIPGSKNYQPVDIPEDNFADLIPVETKIEFDSFPKNLFRIKDGYAYIGDSDIEENYQVVDPSSYDKVDEFFTNIFGIDFKRQKSGLPEDEAQLKKGLELIGLDRDIASIPGSVIGYDIAKKIGDKAIKSFGGKITPIKNIVMYTLGGILGGTEARQAYDYIQGKITGEEKTVEEIWKKLPEDLQTEASFAALGLGFGTIPYLVKRGLVKVDKTAKDVWQMAKNLNLDTYIADFATQGFGKVFLQTGGVFPLVAGPLQSAIKKRAGQALTMLDEFFYSYAPTGTTASDLGRQIIQTSSDVYKKWRYFNAKQWKAFEDLAMGKGTVVKFDSNIVPVRNTKYKQGSEELPFLLDKAKEIIQNAGGMNIKTSNPNYTEAYKAAKVFYDEYAYKNFIPVRDVRNFITKTLGNAQSKSYSSEGGASVGDIIELKKSAERSIENLNLSNIPKDIAEAIKKRYDFAKKTFKVGFESDGKFFEGVSLYERPMAKEISKGEKNIFDIKLTEEGNKYYSEIVKDVLSLGSKESVDDLYKLIGQDDALFGSFIRKYLDDALENTAKVKGSPGGATADRSFNYLNFDPKKFRENLGLPSFEAYVKGGTKGPKEEGFLRALELFSKSPQGKNINPKDFTDLVYLLEKHGSVYVPDAATMLRRASVFGGLSTLLGLHIFGYGDVANSGTKFSLGTILGMRGLTKILANPQNTKFLFEALDSRIPYFQSYNSAIKLLDITLDHLTEEAGNYAGEQRKNIEDYMNFIGEIKKIAIEDMPDKDAERPIPELELEEGLDKDDLTIPAKTGASVTIPNRPKMPVPETTRGTGNLASIIQPINIPSISGGQNQQINPQTVAGLESIGMPLFNAAEGGIVDVYESKKFKRPQVVA